MCIARMSSKDPAAIVAASLMISAVIFDLDGTLFDSTTFSAGILGTFRHFVKEPVRNFGTNPERSHILPVF